MAKALNTFTITDLVNVLTPSLSPSKLCPRLSPMPRSRQDGGAAHKGDGETEGSTAPRQLSFGLRHPTGNQNDLSILKSS